MFAPCQIITVNGKFCIQSTSGTILNDGKDFTEAVRPTMALFRREYRQIGDSMSESIAVGMNMDFCGECEGDK